MLVLLFFIPLTSALYFAIVFGNDKREILITVFVHDEQVHTYIILKH